MVLFGGFGLCCGCYCFAGFTLVDFVIVGCFAGWVCLISLGWIVVCWVSYALGFDLGAIGWYGV